MNGIASFSFAVRGFLEITVVSFLESVLVFK